MTITVPAEGRSLVVIFRAWDRESIMTVRSHMDAVLQLPVLHIEEDSTTGAIPDVLLRGHIPVDTFRRWRQNVTAQNLLFHEYYHFWQVLRLPFLNWYSLTFFMAAYGNFKVLATSLPPHAWPSAGEIRALRPLSVPTTFIFVEDTIIVGPSSDMIAESLNCADKPFEQGQLSVLDLLEGATSYAQWQVAAGPARTQATAYSRWGKFNPAYLHAYRLAGRLIGDRELAFRCFLPLVCAAFYTSDPVRAFIMICRVVASSKPVLETLLIRHSEPLRWDDVFADILSTLSYDAEPDSALYESDGAFFRVNAEVWAYGNWGSAVGHPLNGHLSREWLEREATVPALRSLLSMPGWLRDDVVRDFADTFEPPATICRFHRGTKTLAVGVWGNTKGHLANAFNKHLFMASTIVYGSVRRAVGLNIDKDVRLCSHTSCEWYETNLCNAYINVPLDAKDCGFPSSFRFLLNLAIAKRTT